MANELNALADRINASRTISSPGSASNMILGYLAELVDLLRVDKGPVNQDAQIVALNQTINWQAGILQAVKDALRADPSVTMTQLPALAGEVYMKANPTNL